MFFLPTWPIYAFLHKNAGDIMIDCSLRVVVMFYCPLELRSLNRDGPVAGCLSPFAMGRLFAAQFFVTKHCQKLS